MKHVAIYVRVSSDKQDEASQIPDLEKWSAGQPDPVKWYRDKFTGKSMDRPGWKALEAQIHLGQVSTVVVWRLDRLGRMVSGMAALFEDLQRRNINLVSLRDMVDLRTPAGRLMANVLASVAAYETEIRAERVKSGQDVARSRGKRWGGSKRGRVTKQTLAVETIRTMREMRARGDKIACIARATRVSRQTVYKHLGEVLHG